MWNDFYDKCINDVNDKLNDIIKTKKSISHDYNTEGKHFRINFYPEILDNKIVNIMVVLKNISSSVKTSNKLLENENLLKNFFTKTKYPFVTLDENNKNK